MVEIRLLPIILRSRAPIQYLESRFHIPRCASVYLVEMKQPGAGFQYDAVGRRSEYPPSRSWPTEPVRKQNYKAGVAG